MKKSLFFAFFLVASSVFGQIAEARFQETYFEASKPKTAVFEKVIVRSTEAVIKFSIPQGTNATIKVVTSKGIEMASASGWVEAGTHYISFNTTDFPKGKFYVQIESSDYDTMEEAINL